MKVSLNILKKLRALSRRLKAHGFKLGDVVAMNNTLTRKPWPDIGVVKEVNEYGEYDICWLDGGGSGVAQR